MDGWTVGGLDGETAAFGQGVAARGKAGGAEVERFADLFLAGLFCPAGLALQVGNQLFVLGFLQDGCTLLSALPGLADGAEGRKRQQQGDPNDDDGLHEVVGSGHEAQKGMPSPSGSLITSR